MTIVSGVKTWGEMVRFSHSIFALPFALVAVFYAAQGPPLWGQVSLVVVCMVAARSFAMTFNRIADAQIDARNPRTASRPLPAGRMTLRQAWLFLIICGAVFVWGCENFQRWYGNPWPFRLFAPTLGVLAAYSYTKRFTMCAHFFLGAVIAFAPMAAWIAINPATLGADALLLTGAVLFWIAGFDIIYSCQDFEVDRREGLFSIPAKFGVRKALVISRICHLLTAVFLIAFGRQVHADWLYWAGMALTVALLAAEQAVVRHDDLSRVNLAFFTLNGCVSLLFAMTAIGDMLLI